MNPVVVIRRFEDADDRRVQEIIRAYVLSKFKDAFWFCLFREVSRVSQKNICTQDIVPARRKKSARWINK